MRSLRERSERPVARWSSLKSKVALTLLKLLCFVRIHGVEGLERWIVRKLSVSHAWRRRAARRTARRLYRESRRRGRVFGGFGHRHGIDVQGTGTRVHGTAGQALGPGWRMTVQEFDGENWIYRLALTLPPLVEVQEPYLQDYWRHNPRTHTIVDGRDETPFPLDDVRMLYERSRYSPALRRRGVLRVSADGAG